MWIRKHMLSHSSELINHTWHTYLIFIFLAVWFVLINVLCVCVVPHMLIWWRCGRTDWKTGIWREMQNSIHWHQIRVRNSGGNEKHSMTYVAMYVMCLLNCFLCVVLKELFIVFLWSPCLLHDTCESLCEMNLRWFICTVLCWTSFFSIVCWYVHWSCWKRLCDLLKLINIWQDRDGGKEEKRETN